MFSRFRKDDSDQHQDQSVESASSDEAIVDAVPSGDQSPVAEDAVDSADDDRAVDQESTSAAVGDADRAADRAPAPPVIDGFTPLVDEHGAQDIEEEAAGEPAAESTEAEPWQPRKWVPRPASAPCKKRNNGPLKACEVGRGSYTPQQRILLLDTWQRSGLPAKDFADLVGISKHTLYKWRQQFEKHGPEGLMEQPRQPRRGSRLPEVTKRAIVMLKEAHPEWGCERISDALTRGPALSASPSAVARVLKESGYEGAPQSPIAHGRPKTHRFERARPNQLWQTDLFTFMLKRQNRRLYLVAFMDDHSRFIVSYGLHASASTALVLDVLEAGIANYGAPEEILTDNGPQYVTWRGKSRFTRHLEKRGIKQIVARPKRPQTLGKIERFWGTVWRELIEGSVFVDLADARTRIGHYLDYYNFLRTHLGIDRLVPADRYFSAADQTRLVLKDRVAANALELARGGPQKAPFYLSGNVAGQPFSVHAEGERIVLNRQGGERQEVELVAPPADRDDSGQLPDPICPHAAPASAEGEPAEAPPLPPGQSAIDQLAPLDVDPEDEEGGRS